MAINEPLKQMALDLSGRIYTADRAYMLLLEIGEHADAINAANLGAALGFLQQTLSDQFVLTVTKLFERVTKRNRIRSLPTILDYVRQHVDQLDIAEPYQAAKALAVEMGEPEPEWSFGLSEGLTDKFLDYYTTRMPDVRSSQFCKLSLTLKAVRARRDTSIAHDEIASVEHLPEFTLDQCNDLLRFAKGCLGVLGWAYLSTGFTLSDRSANQWLMESDACMTQNALRRLFYMAGLPRGQPPNTALQTDRVSRDR